MINSDAAPQDEAVHVREGSSHSTNAICAGGPTLAQHRGVSLNNSASFSVDGAAEFFGIHDGDRATIVARGDVVNRCRSRSIRPGERVSISSMM